MKIARHFASISICMLAALFLSACGFVDAASEIVTDSPESSIRQDVSSETLQYTQRYDDFAGCVSDNGYYHITYQSDGSMVLMYLDFASEQIVPLCNRPECKHADDTCTAWLEWRGGEPSLGISGDKLVLFYPSSGAHNYENYGSAAFAQIETRHLNGENKKTLAVFPADTTVSTTWGQDKASLYFLETVINPNETKNALIAIDAASGEKTKICDLSSDTSFLVGAYERNIVIKSFGSSQDVSAQDSLYLSGTVQKFTAVNVDTGEQILLKELPASAVTTLQNDTFYTIDCMSKSIVTQTVSGETRTFEAYTEDDVLDATPYYVIDDSLILGETIQQKNEAGEIEQQTQKRAFNIKTGENAVLTLMGENVNSQDQQYYSLLIATNLDGKILVVPERICKTAIIKQKVGTLSIPVFLPHYAFIEKQNYLQNEANYKMLS